MCEGDVSERMMVSAFREMNDNAIYWTMEDMSGAFAGLNRLHKLGLKMNHIKSITKEAFHGLNRLRQLHLEDNDITTIQENSFKPLQNLKEL
jgi:Leucine-rich repeat (LRR) protein